MFLSEVIKEKTTDSEHKPNIAIDLLVFNLQFLCKYGYTTSLSVVRSYFMDLTCIWQDVIFSMIMSK